MSLVQNLKDMVGGRKTPDIDESAKPTTAEPTHTEESNPKDFAPRKKFTAQIGNKAKNLIVSKGAVLSANGSTRIVGKISAAEAIALMKEAKTMEALDVDRYAEVLSGSEGATIHGHARAVAGPDIMLLEESDDVGN